MKPTKIQHERRIKVLDKIYAKGPISRIDISQETEITPPRSAKSLLISSKKN